MTKVKERNKEIRLLGLNKSMGQRIYSVTLGTLGNYNFRHCRTGFTLLEVMIAVAIIAIVLVAVFGSQSQSLSLANDAKFSTTAALLAQRKMAEVEMEDSLDVSSASGDFGEDFPEYQWELNVSEVPLPGIEGLEFLKQVDVTVRWGDKDQFRYALRLYRFMPKPR
jgi:general secretion pathway protein I